MASSKKLQNSTSIGSLVDNNDASSTVDDYQPIEIKKIPDNQLQCDSIQLDEVYTHRLNTNNPYLYNTNKVAYSYDTGEYISKPVTSVNTLIVHSTIDSSSIHHTSDEYNTLVSLYGDTNIKNLYEKDTDQYKYTDNSTSAADINAGESQLDDEDNSYGNIDNLKNQFQYNTRGTQTGQINQRDKCIATEPPATNEYSAQVTRYDLFDTYLNELHGTNESNQSNNPNINGTAVLSCTALYNSLKIMERIVNHNVELSTYIDYMYYTHHNQPSSTAIQFNTTQPQNVSLDKNALITGTLHTLWKIQPPIKSQSGLSITSISLNKHYNDLFCITYGSYDFIQKNNESHGCVAIYSLKNTSYPESVYTCDSSVLCSDYHPQYSNILVVGTYDGNVSIYDCTLPAHSNPIYTVKNPIIKHQDAVWSVKFKPINKDLSTDLNNINSPQSTGRTSIYQLISISGDGRVVQWNVNKNELIGDELLTKSISISSFDYHPFNPNLILLSYDSGLIELYNLQYNAQLIKSYTQTHHHTIYSSQWNPYVSTIFATCSGDWLVNIYSIISATPDKAIYSIDMNAPVLDMKWSPHSSTVFACCTADGYIRIFDLAYNKYHWIDEIKLGKKLSKLTVLQFHAYQPILYVGDDKSIVHTIKLSYQQIGSPVHDINHTTEIQKFNSIFYIESVDHTIQQLIELNAANNNEKENINKNKLSKPKSGTAKPKTASTNNTDALQSPKSRGKTPGNTDGSRMTGEKPQPV